MLEALKVLFEFVKIFFEFISEICGILYDVFGVFFVMAVVLIVLICLWWVFGGLGDSHEEARAYQNFKNIEKMARNSDELMKKMNKK